MSLSDLEGAMLGSEGQETTRAVFPNAHVGQGIMNNGGHMDIRAIHINNVKDNPNCTPTDVKRNLIEAFRFKSMTDRRDNIDNNYRRTCSWLTQTTEWLQWRREPSSLLWIKGHPGAGKSTIMKYAIRYMQKRDREHIVAYFFDARSATALNKSVEGLYRSLLVQFLQKIPAEAIFESDSFKEASEEGSNKTWPSPRLLELLHEAIYLLETDPITIFIDALDECSEEMLQDTVDHLGDLLDSCGSQLRICFASRYYPHITRREAIDLRLEDQKEHYQDIFLYIEGHLTGSNMRLSDHVRDRLQQKARGSFVWAYLVIRLLKDEYRRGRMAGLEARLEALPKKLGYLYEEILDTKQGDFREETLVCFTMVLLALGSLRVRDLWWAIRSICLPAGEDIGILEEELKQMSEDDLRRVILDVSCGLMTCSGTGVFYDVRFIHETTREFCQQQTGLLSREKNAKMHEAFKSLCWRTIRFYSGKNALLHGDFGYQKPPFLSYAQDHVLRHADSAQQGGIDQSAFLRGFVASNGFELIIRPGSRNYYHGLDTHYWELIDRLVADDYSFLITGSQLLHELASADQRIGLDYSKEWQPRILEAINNQSSTPAALLHLHTKRRKHASHIYNLLASLGRKGLESLKDFYSNENRIDGVYQDVLFDLAEACSPIASFFIVSLTPSRLLQTNEVVRIRDAASAGFVKIFRFLLQRGLPAGLSTFSADEAIRWACRKGHTSIVKVLLEGYLPDFGVPVSPFSLAQPLCLAAWAGHIDSVELLLQHFKGPLPFLVAQIDAIKRLHTRHDFPRSEGVIELLERWLLTRYIPGDVRQGLPANG